MWMQGHSGRIVKRRTLSLHNHYPDALRIGEGAADRICKSLRCCRPNNVPSVAAVGKRFGIIVIGDHRRTARNLAIGVAKAIQHVDHLAHRNCEFERTTLCNAILAPRVHKGAKTLLGVPDHVARFSASPIKEMTSICTLLETARLAASFSASYLSGHLVATSLSVRGSVIWTCYQGVKPTSGLRSSGFPGILFECLTQGWAIVLF